MTPTALRALVAAATLLLTAGVATVASADPGGSPNANACTGRVVAILASQTGGRGGAGKVSMQDCHFVQRVQQLCAAGWSPEQVVQKVREGAP